MKGKIIQEGAMKDKRQAKILEIVSQEAIETQEQLLVALAEAGFPTTQSTVSRDIKELGLGKSPSGGRLVYMQVRGQLGYSLTDRMMRTLRNALLAVDFAGNFIVLKTFEGGAHAAAAALDKLQFEEIMGTIAGDNTILVIVKDQGMVENVAKRLIQLIDR
jgi:transcriptional regulator of arginine metabolism